MADLLTGFGGDFGFGEIQVPIGDSTRVTGIDLTSIFPNGLRFGDSVATSVSVYTDGYAVFSGSDGASFTVAPYKSSLLWSLNASTASSGGTSAGSGRVWIDLDEITNTLTVTWDDVRARYQVPYPHEPWYETLGPSAFQFQFKNTEDEETILEIRYERLQDLSYHYLAPSLSSFLTTSSTSESIPIDPYGSNVGETGLWRFTYDPALSFEPPATRSDAFAVPIGETAVLDILSNDPLGIEVAAGSIHLVTNPQNGIVKVLPDDRLVYLQTRPGATTDKFEYSVFGTNGLAAPPTRIRIDHISDGLARSAHDDAIWAEGLEPVAIRIDDLLSNDRAHGLLPEIGSFEVTQSLHGHAEASGNYVVFEIGDGFRGVGAFEYRIIDQSGATLEPVLVRVEVHVPEYFLGTDQPDIISAGAGDESIFGQAGRDWLNGRNGDDDIRGHEGDDSLHGGSGNDRLAGGSGSDRLEGGDGNDWLLGDHGGSGADGDDVLLDDWGDDVLLGHGGNDFLSAGRGSDRFRGHEGDDVLLGSSDDDFLYGGEGADDLNGGTGVDVLCGGSGDDILRGGLGSDRFVFEPGFGADVITDYEVGVDRIRLNRFGPGMDFEDIAPLIEQRDGRAIIIFSESDVLALLGTEASSLSAHDFVFR